MDDLAARLQALGFVPFKDFWAEDAGDGNGAYIAKWCSEEPLPSTSQLEAVVVQEPRVSQVSSAQAKLALDAAGILDDVEAVVAAHPVRAVRIWFADANTWVRSHPYISALGLEMSLDDPAIDALFEAAQHY